MCHLIVCGSASKSEPSLFAGTTIRLPMQNQGGWVPMVNGESSGINYLQPFQGRANVLSRMRSLTSPRNCGHSESAALARRRARKQHSPDKSEDPASRGEPMREEGHDHEIHPIHVTAVSSAERDCRRRYPGCRQWRCGPGGLNGAVCGSA